MPSPLAHMAMGYAVYRTNFPHPAPSRSRWFGTLPFALLATMGLSILPDLDMIPGFLVGDIGRFHRGMMSSIFTGLFVALAVAVGVWLIKRAGSVRWFFVTLLCYQLHVIMDYFTSGRGVMALWPFSTEYYASTIQLFYGLHYSQGWISMMHLWTLVTESLFVVVLILVLRLFLRVLGPCPYAQQVHSD